MRLAKRFSSFGGAYKIWNGCVRDCCQWTDDAVKHYVL